MILRRVIAHFRKQEWTAIALDFLIVVVGVFVGLQVNNWNAARAERASAANYIERVREDLAETRRAVEVRVAYYLQVRTRGVAALEAFEQPKESLGEAFLIDAFQATQVLSQSIDRSTYDELLTAGTLNAFSDLEIRKRIKRFYQGMATTQEILDYVPPYRESLRRLMPYKVQAALLADCDDLSVTDASGAQQPMLDEACEIGLPESDIKAAVDAIFDEELRRDLVRRLSDIDTKLINYRRTIMRAEALDAFLEAHAK